MPLHLDDMALFVEVVKARSFSRAAAAIGMPNSSLSRRISELEKSIGLRLLNRTTRKVEPTEAGLIYFERSRRLVDEARIAHEELGDMLAQPAGLLRVSLPVDFAVLWLAPLMPELRRLYPRLDYDLDLTPRNVDLVSEPFDLAIRMINPTQSGLVSRVIGRLAARLYASPGYLERSPLNDVAQLTGADCLTMATMPCWRLRCDGQSVELKVGSPFKANSVAFLRSLAVAGLGVVFLPEHAVTDELATGSLVRVLAPWEGEPTPIYAVTETKLVPAKTQRFIEFLIASLR